MMLGSIGLFKGIMTKMNYLDQNHQTLAANIANADTPGFRPKQLIAPDFASVMQAATTGKLRVAATHEGHVGAGGKVVHNMDERKQRTVYESSPDNNGVVVEEQLYKANINNIDANLMNNLYRRNLGMLRLAIQGANG